MPTGRPPKRQHGTPKKRNVDPKLPKVRRDKIVRKLKRPVADVVEEQNNNNDGGGEVREKALEHVGEVSKERKQGRPSLSTAGPMNQDQLKERRKELNKARRDESKEKERQDEITNVRRSAAGKRWKSEEEKKKQHKPDKCDEEVLSLLPDGFAVKLDILSMVAPSFPECPILSSKPCLANRLGKSTIYKQLRAVKNCLISCPLANQVILSWACKLAITDYNELIFYT